MASCKRIYHSFLVSVCISSDEIRIYGLCIKISRVEVRVETYDFLIGVLKMHHFFPATVKNRGTLETQDDVKPHTCKLSHFFLDKHFKNGRHF